MNRVGRVLVSESFLVLWVGMLVAWGGTARAQTFYKWTDDRGVVHLSDSPPQQGQGVEERHLPPPPVPPAARAHVSSEEAESGGEAPPTAGPHAEGPARIILSSRQNPRTGPSSMHLIGQVKNVGGADAQHVAVTVIVVDATQGTPCLREDVAVTPSTLRPGESGNFDVDLDSPCLFGEPNLDVVPAWD